MNASYLAETCEKMSDLVPLNLDIIFFDVTFFEVAEVRSE